LKTAVACFKFNNDIFNSLTKYTQYNYSNFEVNAGMDYGEYAWYEIEDEVYENEDTTIGGVANNAAKIQTFAYKDYIYIMDKFYKNLPEGIKEKFTEIDESRMEKIKGKIKDSKVYEAKYNQIFSDEIMADIDAELENVKKRTEEEANKLNISEITFSDVKVKVDFSKLSINNNKRLYGGILCADIRGFTKLFNKNDSNLDDLCDVMQELYSIMGAAINEEDGVKVQYQGDRIVALFNDFAGVDPFRIRMIRSALKLNERIQEFNNRSDISKKLKKNNIAIGIGCGSGNIIATRLGMNGSKDNIVLSEGSKTADKAEDDYAEKNTVVICKQLHDEIVAEAKNSTYTEYKVFEDEFTAISTTGYYSSDMIYSEFQQKLNEKKRQEQEQKAKEIFCASFITNSMGEKVNTKTRPWGNSL
jgi:class 3 adenylate cyclase